MKNSRHIGIYLGRHSGQGGGIGRYCQSLVEELCVLLERNEFGSVEFSIFACSKIANTDFEKLCFKLNEKGAQRIKIFKLSEKYGRWLGLVLDQLLLPRIIRRLKLDALLSTSNVGLLRCSCSQFVVVHDLFQAYPAKDSSRGNLSQLLKQVFYRYNIASMSKTSQGILCDSKQSFDSIVKRFPHAKERTHIIELGLDRELDRVFSRLVQAQIREEDVDLFLSQHCAKAGFILAIWSDNPRKNMHRAIQSWCELRELGPVPKLFIVVESQEVAKRVSKLFTPAQRADVLITTWVSREELAMLYIAASILLFPSIEEGFGLPAYEMLAFKGTVVAGPLSFNTLPSTTLQNLLFCDPYSKPSILEQLQIATNREPQCSLGEKLDSFKNDSTVRNFNTVCKETFHKILGQNN
jgi:glycosyltransferase involved in cell wall biosynthesis